ncbi:MAG: hypothetical protein ABIB71_07180 [Candidatus Woesearchaeota archaeon]
MLKKGDLQMRYIVLIALGLLVLIVVALIFSGSADWFVTKLKGIAEQFASFE